MNVQIKKNMAVLLFCFLCLILSPLNAFAHHHKHDNLVNQTNPKMLKNPLNPRQGPEDITPFARQAAQNALQNQLNQSNRSAKLNEHQPTAQLLNHYTQQSDHLDAKRGWVNSKHRHGKNDIGINLPLPETADPTSNKVRGVFRRATPLYEPDY